MLSLNTTTVVAIYIVIAIIIWTVLIVDARKTKVYDLLERKWLRISPLELFAITMIAVGWICLAIGIILSKLFKALFSKNKPAQCLQHENTGDS